MTDREQYIAKTVNGSMLPTREQIDHLAGMALAIQDYPVCEEERDPPFVLSDYDFRADYTMGKVEVMVGLAHTTSKQFPDITVNLSRYVFPVQSGLVYREFEYDFGYAGLPNKRQYRPTRLIERYVQCSWQDEELITSDITRAEGCSWRAWFAARKAIKLQNRLGTNQFTMQHYWAVEYALDHMDPANLTRGANPGYYL